MTKGGCRTPSRLVIKIENLFKAVEFDSEDTSSYINCGLAYYYMDNNELAIDDYHKAIHHDPEDPG